MLAAGITGSMLRFSTGSPDDIIITFDGRAGSIVLHEKAFSADFGPNAVHFVGENVTWSEADLLTAYVAALGTAAADTIHATYADDNVIGWAANDLVYGWDGNDTLNGGSGDDAMHGGLGNDEYVVQQAGDLTVEAAGEGRDRVISYLDHVLAANIEDLTLAGNARSGTGNALDNFIGGTMGQDTLRGLDGADGLWGYSDIDTLDGGGGNDVLYGGLSIDFLEGGADDDRLNGEDGNDNVSGGDGIDRLFGGDGHDTLVAGAGNDELRGGNGMDTQTGGLGLDRFAFDDGETSHSSVFADVVTDFSQAEGDRLHLRLMDADSNLADEQNFTFLGTTAFSGAGTGGELRYKYYQGNTYVEGDLQGDGTADFMIRLNGLQTLTATDFVL